MKIGLKVRSSAIERLDYNSESRVLTITFCGGRPYDYYECTSSDVLELVKAKSVGKHFNTYIRKQHAWKGM